MSFNGQEWHTCRSFVTAVERFAEAPDRVDLAEAARAAERRRAARVRARAERLAAEARAPPRLAAAAAAAAAPAGPEGPGEVRGVGVPPPLPSY